MSKCTSVSKQNLKEWKEKKPIITMWENEKFMNIDVHLIDDPIKLILKYAQFSEKDEQNENGWKLLMNFKWISNQPLGDNFNRNFN